MVNILFLIFVALASSFSPSALAETVELANPNFYNEYKDFIQKNYGLYNKRDHDLLKKLNHSSKIIESKYKLAVDGLVKVDLNNSIQLFKEIINFHTIEIFNINSRDLISNSFFHLASVEKNKLSYWTKKAALFNSNFIPDSNIFNPLIIKSFKEHLNTTALKPRVSFDVESNVKTFINGTKAHGDYMENKEYYVTLYKSGYLPLKKTVNSNDFDKISSKLMTPENLGTCAAPKFKKSIDKIYFSPDCIKSKLVNNDSYQTAKFSANNPVNEIDLKIQKPKTSFISKKSTWIVIGASLIATSAVIIINDQNKNTSFKPVHRISTQ